MGHASWLLRVVYFHEPWILSRLFSAGARSRLFRVCLLWRMKLCQAPADSGVRHNHCMVYVLCYMHMTWQRLLQENVLFSLCGKAKQARPLFSHERDIG